MRLTKSRTERTSGFGKVGKLDCKLGTNTILRSRGRDGPNYVVHEVGALEKRLVGERGREADIVGVVGDDLGVLGGGDVAN